MKKTNSNEIKRFLALTAGIGLLTAAGFIGHPFCLILCFLSVILNLVLLFYVHPVYTDAGDESMEALERAIEEKYKTQLLYTQAQIDALQSQINPHFLYNTLEEIRGLALIKDDYDIADMTEALALMFRYSINQDNKHVTFEQELHNLENYILIQHFRFPDKFTLQYDLDPSDDSLMHYRLPKLTLQPIVENAIQHGFDVIEHHGLISIKAVATQNRLLIRIRDNGKGMEPAQLEALNHMLEDESSTLSPTQNVSKTGIALINVNLRIKLNFGTEYGLFVSSTRHVGTTVEIRLPLRKESSYAESSFKNI